MALIARAVCHKPQINQLQRRASASDTIFLSSESEPEDGQTEEPSLISLLLLGSGSG